MRSFQTSWNREEVPISRLYDFKSRMKRAAQNLCALKLTQNEAALLAVPSIACQGESSVLFTGVLKVLPFYGWCHRKKWNLVEKDLSSKKECWVFCLKNLYLDSFPMNSCTFWNDITVCRILSCYSLNLQCSIKASNKSRRMFGCDGLGRNGCSMCWRHEN